MNRRDYFEHIEYNTMRAALSRYYRATAFLRQNVMDKLQIDFEKTRHLMFLAVARILAENYADFQSEYEAFKVSVWNKQIWDAYKDDVKTWTMQNMAGDKIDQNGNLAKPLLGEQMVEIILASAPEENKIEEEKPKKATNGKKAITVKVKLVPKEKEVRKREKVQDN